MALIEAALDGLGVRHRFKHVFSAEHEAYGKPHPGVYISAAKGIGECTDWVMFLQVHFQALLQRACGQYFIVVDAHVRNWLRAIVQECHLSTVWRSRTPSTAH
jgi:mannitol-1-/sugar-/sorbitol-6-/2-deoxyglucose-6-phosphatase